MSRAATSNEMDSRYRPPLYIKTHKLCQRENSQLQPNEKAHLIAWEPPHIVAYDQLISPATTTSSSHSVITAQQFTVGSALL